MSRINLNNDKGENSQVLPQFRDTKLGKLRFGKQAPRNGGFDMQNDWRIVVLFIVVNLAFLASSLILIYPLGQPIAGWVIFGIWALLSLCGLICLIIIFFRSRRVKKKRSEHFELGSRVSSNENIRKLPHDPVMNRAITMLVYHGQEDCEECRLLRHREDFQRRVKEWSVVGTPETFEHIKLPSTSHQGDGGRHHRKHSNSLHPNGAYESVQAPRQFQDHTIEDKDLDRRMYMFMDDDNPNGDLFSDESLEDECFYNVNQNNNNNANDRLTPNGVLRPTMIITPPPDPVPNAQSNDDESTRGYRRHTVSESVQSGDRDLNNTSHRSGDEGTSHVEGKEAQTLVAQSKFKHTPSAGLNDQQDSFNNSKPNSPDPTTTRKYRKVGRKVPVSKEPLAITRRRRKKAGSTPTKKSTRSRRSSSSGTSDTEKSKEGELTTQRRSARLPTTPATSSVKTINEQGLNAQQSSRDSVTSDYDDVTYEWVQENFNKRTSIEKIKRTDR